MFGRPRCREWTPLATQQLRLRSLIQIVGYNIRPPEGCQFACSFYFSLHHTSMSAPFYTSERISSPHPKWKEIDSEITQRMSSSNVVIRIWCHTLQVTSKKCDEKTETTDSIIQTWGVYFSGLRYIGANLTLNFTSDCFKSNTLVFQMIGGYFCSYKSLKLDVIPPENQIDHGSLSSDSSCKTSISQRIPIDKLAQYRLKESRSVSLSKREYSRSHSPVERNFKYPVKYSSSLNISKDQKVTDSNQIYEHSPDSLDVDCDSISKHMAQELYSSRIDLSETAESYDLRNEMDGVPKYRYLALSFLKSEIRPSYNSSKLQKLHLLQYSIKKRQEAVQEIKERIYKKSAITNSEDWLDSERQLEMRLKFRSRSQKNIFSADYDLDIRKASSQSNLSMRNGMKVEERPSNGPRLTLKLNDLLSFKSKPSPLQRAEHIKLTKQLEILRFKRIILSDERDSKLANLRRLKEIRAKLYEENQDLSSELMVKYHTLSRLTEGLKETRQSASALRQLAAKSHTALVTKRCDMLLALHDIFYIEEKDQSTWTICSVPLPICGDETRRINRVTDAVAAGLVAQATTIAANVLNQPLRYKIALQGSASRILDISNELPDPNVPLYPRSGDMLLFRYAMFLLNKCIAQLLWGRGLPVMDIKPTLANLRRLLTSQCNLSDTAKLYGTHKWLEETNCPRTQSLRSLVASERGKHRQFNRFKDAVDGQSPHTAMCLRRHRLSRSVGSYRDDPELPNFATSTTSVMGSEPSLYDAKLMGGSQKLTKAHCSYTEVSNISTDRTTDSTTGDKVIFTLGDDSALESLNADRLLRISTNNEYMTVENVCSEITDFCDFQENTTCGLCDGQNVCAEVGCAKTVLTADALRGDIKSDSASVACSECDAPSRGDT